jgi:hypothetical protein
MKGCSSVFCEGQFANIGLENCEKTIFTIRIAGLWLVFVVVHVSE